MPRLDESMQSLTVAGRGGFAFTGARFDKLGAANYTLATAAVDVSGSTGPFRQLLVDMLKMTLDACKKDPRSDNILFRVILVSDRFPKGVEEVHGFKLLTDIDPAVYDSLRTGGNTPLIDGCYSGVGATNKFAKELKTKDYESNGVTFFITDGAENASTATMGMLKKELEEAVTSETLESLISILIGINAKQYQAVLEDFQRDAGITHYKDAGEATPRNIAKLANFVSTSVSSTAQAAGTGGPSQNIAAVI